MTFNAIPAGLEPNETVNKVLHYFNASVANFSNVLNQSDENNVKPFDLYEAIKDHEKEHLITFKTTAYIVGSLIILSNFIVVISSGLILKKGQQPKSTYMLLGNVSLADTLIGVSIIIGATIEPSKMSGLMCVVQTGMLVSPAMVSIFSVGLIAVDRYIYILHGLYYHRWFNTTKVRVAIVCIWMIGITLGFMPLTGWTNRELDFIKRCSYVILFPASVVIFNSVLSTLPILLVGVLYSIILVKALKNVKKIKASKSYANSLHALDKQDKGIFSGKGKNIEQSDVSKNDSIHSVKLPKNSNDPLKRSTSLDSNLDRANHNQFMTGSITDLANTDEKVTKSKSCEDIAVKVDVDVENSRNSNSESEFSIYSIASSVPNISTLSTESVKGAQEAKGAQPQCKCCWKSPNVNKPKKPNKWRAIIIVMLTSGSFILTWLPFFLMVIFYEMCENKRYNVKCHNFMLTFGGPLTTLAFLNSILNPLIYAWWHKGFQKSIRAYFKKYFRKRCSNAALANKNIKVKY